MPCALFLATKTENSYISLQQFAERIPGDTTAEDVIAPEFLLMQSLRFTFDVRHPFRGLEGGVLELNAIAEGQGQPAPHLPSQTPESLRQGLLSIPPHKDGRRYSSIVNRIAHAHGEARETLKSAAQMTDVYFLYTPAHIWLSAFFLADKPLMEFYLNSKLGPDPQTQSSNGSTQNPQNGSSKDPNNAISSIRAKLVQTITKCSNILQSYKPISSDAGEVGHLKRIAKKLYHCQNPEKVGGIRGSATADQLAGHKRDVGAAGTPTASSSIAGTAESGRGVPESETDRLAKKRKLEPGVEAGGEESGGISGPSLVDRVKER